MTYGIEARMLKGWTEIDKGISHKSDALVESAIYARIHREVRGIAYGSGQKGRYGKYIAWMFKDGRLRIRQKGEKWR